MAGERDAGTRRLLRELLAPAPGLLRRQPAALRAYARNLGAVLLNMGPEVARAYGRLLERVAELEPAATLGLADAVPTQLAGLEPGQRLRYLDLLVRALDGRSGSAASLAETLPELLPRMEDEALLRFLETGKRLLADSRERALSFLRVESEEARSALDRLQPGLALEEHERVLALYARAHCGEDVRLRSTGRVLRAGSEVAEPGSAPLLPGGQGVFTDGHLLHLPAVVDVFGDESDFLFLKVGTAHAAAYLEFGTFDLLLDELSGDFPPRREGETELERFLRAFPRRFLARDLFQLCEDARVLARLREAYPGVARDLDRLLARLPQRRPDYGGLTPVQQLLEAGARHAWGLPRGSGWDPALGPELEALWERMDALRDERARVRDTARSVQELYPRVEALYARSREGSGQAERARERRRGRRPRLKGRGEGTGSGLQRRRARVEGASAAPEPELRGALRPEERDAEARGLDELAWRLLATVDRRGRALRFTEARREARRRRAVDYEEMDRWLEKLPGPAGGRVDPERKAPDDPRESLPPVLREGVEGLAEGRGLAFLYPEWDAAIGDYKPDWVRLKEYRVAPGDRSFVDETMGRYGALIGRLRRQFEALRPQEVALLRALPDGDSLDLDRVIEARVVRRAGGPLPERLYCRHQRDRRDVAVAFLLDMSSSTNEVVGQEGKRVIQVEKEALVLIAEALDALGDAFAIYGFSGYGREQVAFYVAKDFGEAYDDAARRRIGRLSWKMENRDGAAIRHATRKLLAQPSRIRLLVLLSDGKPLDCGDEQYYDRYAQEDTRMALREARRAGVHPFCITVDPLARDYLARMYGRHGYAVIERVEALPARIPRIYRRLTR